MVKLGSHGRRLLETFEGYGTPTVARTVSQHLNSPRLTTLARTHGLALYVDPETQLNTVPVEWRPAHYANVPYATGGAWDPLTEPLSRDDQRRYVRHVLRAQALAGATLFVSPYHRAGLLDDPCRQFDLALLERSVAAFEQARLVDSDASPFPLRREIYAPILMDVDSLRDGEGRRRLIAAYAEIDVSGFIVGVIDFSEEMAVADIECVSEFVLELQTVAQRPVVLNGGKNIGPALVGVGLAAQMIGVAQGEICRYPQAPRRITHRRRPVFHQVALRSLDPFSDRADVRLRAREVFEESPCDCGHHVPHEVPATGFNRVAHTFSQRLQLAYALSHGSATDRHLELVRRHAAALELATRCGLGPPPAVGRVIDAAECVARRYGSSATGELLDA